MKSLLWSTFALCALLSLASSSEATGKATVPAAPGQHQVGLQWAGHRRTFLVNVPSTYSPSQPVPMVLLFHGSGQTAGKFARKRGELVRRADRAGIILVFPQALEVSGRTRWNETDPPGMTVDDPGFVEAMLATLKSNLAVDERRVYAAGFSNGGVFSYYLAATRPDRFAAIAAVGSNVRTPQVAASGFKSPTPAPQAPMPAMLIHGLQDTSQPYYGGVNKNGRLMASAADTAAFWVRANGCQTAPLERGDAWKQEKRWSGCRDGSEVVWISVAQMPHNWPDRRDGYHFDGNRAILEFFLRHHR